MMMCFKIQIQMFKLSANILLKENHGPKMVKNVCVFNIFVVKVFMSEATYVNNLLCNYNSFFAF